MQPPFLFRPSRIAWVVLVATGLTLTSSGALAGPFYKKRYIPRAQKIAFKTQWYTLDIFGRTFGQGEMLYLNIRFKEKPAGKPEILWGTSRVDILQKNDPKPSSQGSNNKAFVYDGLYGVATWAKPGKRIISVRFAHQEGGGTVNRLNKHSLNISKTDFFVRKVRLTVAGKYTAPSAAQVARIKKERELKAKVFGLVTPRKWQGQFSDARNMSKITSPFYTRRMYNTGKTSSPHSGVDLKGRIGAPIKALNRGKVVLARELFYEGNMVVIDHGEGFFSYYLHQSMLLVKEGQLVKTGQIIGRVGMTGMVTGPHLHLSVKYKGRLQSPLSLLSLPVD